MGVWVAQFQHAAFIESASKGIHDENNTLRTNRLGSIGSSSFHYVSQEPSPLVSGCALALKSEAARLNSSSSIGTNPDVREASQSTVATVIRGKTNTPIFIITPIAPIHLFSFPAFLAIFHLCI